jgi:hypothetical protein
VSVPSRVFGREIAIFSDRSKSEAVSARLPNRASEIGSRSGDRKPNRIDNIPERLTGDEANLVGRVDKLPIRQPMHFAPAPVIDLGDRNQRDRASRGSRAAACRARGSYDHLAPKMGAKPRFSGRFALRGAQKPSFGKIGYLGKSMG